MTDQPIRDHWTRAGDILIVDDEAVILQTCSANLERFGCNCHSAASYAEAIKTFESEPRIRVVITDHAMHGESTEGFVAAIRRIRPGVVVVGSSGAACGEEFGAIGVERFLQKPWNADELEELLAGRLDRCVSCGIDLPLRRPFPGETATSWVCRFCGGRYRGVLDKDAAPDVRQNASPVERD